MRPPARPPALPFAASLLLPICMPTSFPIRQEVFADTESVFTNIGHDESSAICWNGLRVRVAIHYGVGDIIYDPVVKGYDYQGAVVNTATRMLSLCHGGQVCIRCSQGGTACACGGACAGAQELLSLSVAERLGNVSGVSQAWRLCSATTSQLLSILRACPSRHAPILV